MLNGLTANIEKALGQLPTPTLWVVWGLHSSAPPRPPVREGGWVRKQTGTESAIIKETGRGAKAGTTSWPRARGGGGSSGHSLSPTSMSPGQGSSTPSLSLPN